MNYLISAFVKLLCLVWSLSLDVVSNTSSVDRNIMDVKYQQDVRYIFDAALMYE